MSKLFLCYYSPVVEISRRDWLLILGFQLNKEKNDGFWLLWGTFNECIKQNIIKAVLRKANAHSVDICRLMENQWYIKKDQGEKWNHIQFSRICKSAKPLRNHAFHKLSNFYKFSNDDFPFEQCFTQVMF